MGISKYLLCKESILLIQKHYFFIQVLKETSSYWGLGTFHFFIVSISEWLAVFPKVFIDVIAELFQRYGSPRNDLSVYGKFKVMDFLFSVISDCNYYGILKL